ncbi:MAG: hypothetical protein ACKPKO_05635, partial [Candidatus Fonsibacter sp.]
NGVRRATTTTLLKSRIHHVERGELRMYRRRYSAASKDDLNHQYWCEIRDVRIMHDVREHIFTHTVEAELQPVRLQKWYRRVANTSSDPKRTNNAL